MNSAVARVYAVSGKFSTDYVLFVLKACKKKKLFC